MPPFAFFNKQQGILLHSWAIIFYALAIKKRIQQQEPIEGPAATYGLWKTTKYRDKKTLEKTWPMRGHRASNDNSVGVCQRRFTFVFFHVSSIITARRLCAYFEAPQLRHFRRLLLNTDLAKYVCVCAWHTFYLIFFRLISFSISKIIYVMAIFMIIFDNFFRRVLVVTTLLLPYIILIFVNGAAPRFCYFCCIFECI